jgi:alpha/beta superfamily hydrolase
MIFGKDNWQTADAVLEHQSGRFKDWLVGTDANHFWRHHVFDSHDPTLD